MTLRLLWAVLSLITAVGALASMRRVYLVDRSRPPLWWLLFGIFINSTGLSAILFSNLNAPSTLPFIRQIVYTAPYLASSLSIGYFFAYLLGVINEPRKRK